MVFWNSVQNEEITIRVTDLTGRTILTRTIEAIICLLYTSDAADERSSVDLGGRRIIKKKKYIKITEPNISKSVINNKHTKQTRTLY